MNNLKSWREEVEKEVEKYYDENTDEKVNWKEDMQLLDDEVHFSEKEIYFQKLTELATIKKATQIFKEDLHKLREEIQVKYASSLKGSYHEQAQFRMGLDWASNKLKELKEARNGK